MAEEVCVALFQRLDDAEKARRDLEASGIPVADIDLRARELTGFGAYDTEPQHGGVWEQLFAREPGYRRHIEAGGTLLAVRAEGEEYDRIATILLQHDLHTPKDQVPGKTSESARVRRYVIEAAERVPLHEEKISLAGKD